MNRRMLELIRCACCIALAMFTLATAQGQKPRRTQTAPDEGPAASVGARLTHTANGLQLVHIQSDAYTSAALAMDWTFKPALEVQRTGIGKAWARVLSEQWKSDTLGTGLQFSWVVTPTGFIGFGDDATVDEWGTLMLNGLRSTPESNWPKVQANWINNWDSAYHLPNAVAERVLNAEMFSLRHPYGELELPGTLKAISEADVQHHATSYWHPNNGRLVFASPLDQNEIPNAWLDIIGDLPARELKKPVISPPSKPRQSEAFIAESASDASDSVHVEAGHLMRLKPNHSDALPLLILTEHLASTASTSFTVELDALMSSLRVTASGSATSAIASIRSLQDAMAAATRSVPTSDELDGWKRMAHAQTLKDLQSPSAAARLFLERPDWFYAAVDTAWAAFMSPVHPNDIQRVAINYLRPNNLQLAAVGPVNSARTVAEAFAAPQHIHSYDLDAQPKSIFGPVPDGLTALDVIREHYDACGGEQAFAALSSCRRFGTMEAGGGMVMKVESEEIYGVGYRTSISIDGEVMMEQIVKPGSGISTKLGKPQPMPKAEYQRSEHRLYAMEWLALDERNMNAVLVGSYQRQGSQEWVIDVSRDGGLVQRLFFDAETHLLVRSEEHRTGPTGPIEVFLEYGAYKDFDGLLYATQVTRQTNNQRMVTTLNDVQPNARVSKSQFEWE